ncbi:MAG: ribonuclease H-like domain-containing protein, partial [Verrucomicrobia bacterium]|nr:ribonuclease H-like domain-containing protein [Verrucomicrobiota bacterium]
MTQRLIYFDTETTHIRADIGRIIELAAYDPVTGKSFEQLINPLMPIPPDASKIHKITDAMVAKAPTFAQVGADFIEFCHGDAVLVGHNCDSFDLPYLRAEFTRNGLILPPHWIFVDSLKWARKYRKDLPRHSLQYLRQIYGIAENEAHRALNDVKVLMEVFQSMIDDLTPEEVVLLLGSSADKMRALPETKKPAPL